MLILMRGNLLLILLPMLLLLVLLLGYRLMTAVYVSESLRHLCFSDVSALCHVLRVEISVSW